MVIKRTIETPFMQPQDVEIELTPTELRMAHQEMQEEYDATDMLYYIEEIEDDLLDEGMSPKKVKELKKLKYELGAELRRNLDKYEMSWEYARPEALRKVAFRVFDETYANKYFG